MCHLRGGPSTRSRFRLRVRSRRQTTSVRGASRFDEPLRARRSLAVTLYRHSRVVERWHAPVRSAAHVEQAQQQLAVTLDRYAWPLLLAVTLDRYVPRAEQAQQLARGADRRAVERHDGVARAQLARQRG